MEVALSWSRRGTVKWPIFLSRSIWSELNTSSYLRHHGTTKSIAQGKSKLSLGDSEVKRKFDVMAELNLRIEQIRNKCRRFWTIIINTISAIWTGGLWLFTGLEWIEV